MSIKYCENINRRIIFLEIEFIFIKVGNEQRKVLLRKKLLLATFMKLLQISQISCSFNIQTNCNNIINQNNRIQCFNLEQIKELYSINLCQFVLSKPFFINNTGISKMINKNQARSAQNKTFRTSKSNHSEKYSQVKLLTGRLRSIKQLSLSKFKKIGRNSDSCAQSFRSSMNNKQSKDETNYSIINEKLKKKIVNIQTSLREQKKNQKSGERKGFQQNMSEQKQNKRYFDETNKIDKLKESLKSSKNILKQKFRKIKQSSTSLWNLQSCTQVSINQQQSQFKTQNHKLLKKQMHEFQLLESKLKQILQNTEKEKTKYITLKSLIIFIEKQQQEKKNICSQKILNSPCFPTQIQDIFLNEDSLQKNSSLNQGTHKKLLKLKQFQIESLQKQIHLIIKATNQNFAKMRKNKEEVLAFRKERVMFSCFNKKLQKQIKKQETQYMKLILQNKKKLSIDASFQTNELVQKVNAIFKKHHEQQKGFKSLKVIRQQSNNTDCFFSAQLQRQNKEETSKNSCISFYAQNKKRVMISLRNKTKDVFKKNLEQRYEQLKNRIQFYQNTIHKIYNTFSINHCCQKEDFRSKPNKQFEILKDLQQNQKKQSPNIQETDLFQINQQQNQTNILKIREKIINLSTKNNLILTKIKKYDDLISNYEQKKCKENENQIKLRTKWLYQDQKQEQKYQEELKFNLIKKFSEVIFQIKKLLPFSQNQKKQEDFNFNFQNKILSKIEQVVIAYNTAKLKQESDVSIQNIKKISKKINFKFSLQTPQFELDADQDSIENDIFAENYNKFKSFVNFGFQGKQNLKGEADNDLQIDHILSKKKKQLQGQKEIKKSGSAHQSSTNNFIEMNKLNKQRSSIHSKPINQLIQSLSGYQNADKILNRKDFQKQYLKMIKKNEKKKKTPLIKKPLFSIY